MSAPKILFKSGQMKLEAKRILRRQHNEIHELSSLALHACSIASDAAFNIKDFLLGSSPMAFLAVRDCEKELDRIEQQIDEELPSALSRVSEPQARELLAASRFSTELERIGDLLFGVGKRLQNLRMPLSRGDMRNLAKMLEILEEMLKQLRISLEGHELDGANYVLSSDREIDRIYRGFLGRHLAAEGIDRMQQSTEVLLVAQVLERAGDHATNLAEELFRLVEGRSLRHTPKRELPD
jgi:phosphate transport system protein